MVEAQVAPLRLAGRSAQLKALIADAKVTADDIAACLGINRYAVVNKLAYRRQWHLRDIAPLLSLLSERLCRVVTFEEAFCYRLPAPTRRRRRRRQVA